MNETREKFNLLLTQISGKKHDSKTPLVGSLETRENLLSKSDFQTLLLQMGSAEKEKIPFSYVLSISSYALSKNMRPEWQDFIQKALMMAAKE